MRRRLLVLALVLVTTGAAGAAQLHKVNVDDITTRHTYDPAKLKIVEKKLTNQVPSTSEVIVWQVLTDYDLILGTVSTKAEADVVLTATKKFTTMVIVGRRPRTFTYFER